MTRTSFSRELRAAASGIWEAQHDHPFVRGIADGTLSVERFEHYVRQDYVFLIDYARVLALGAARAPDLPTMRRFAELAQAILATEMDLHRSLAAQFGISERQLEAEEPAPTTQGYTDFLVRTAAVGDFAEVAAALLPCMWGYAEIGEELGAHPRPPDERYAAWVDMYASAEFQELAAWCRDLVDRLAAGARDQERQRLMSAFVTSSRWELAFWDMAWRMERWGA